MEALANCQIFSVTEIMGSVAKILYNLAPRCRPRNVEVIMAKLYSALLVNTHIKLEFGDFYHFELDSVEEMLEIVKSILMSIPEFVDLNLSYNEVQAGIKVNDDRRPNFVFHSAYDVRNEDSWKDDFIDLDAFMQNLDCELESTHNPIEP